MDALKKCDGKPMAEEMLRSPEETSLQKDIG
jgi:hypothetical protein